MSRVKSPSLKDKIAYFAKVRQGNYADSLRLEGFTTSAKVASKQPGLAGANKKTPRSPE